MRFLSAALFFLILLNFSGVPDLIAGFSDCDCGYVDMNDDADSKEKEDTKEKEKEDVKESVLADHLCFHQLHSGISIEIRNGILLDSGYYPEDHSPPPELA